MCLLKGGRHAIALLFAESADQSLSESKKQTTDGSDDSGTDQEGGGRERIVARAAVAGGRSAVLELFTLRIDLARFDLALVCPGTPRKLRLEATDHLREVVGPTAFVFRAQALELMLDPRLADSMEGYRWACEVPWGRMIGVGGGCFGGSFFRENNSNEEERHRQTVA
jgi:hypothetical protein